MPSYRSSEPTARPDYVEPGEYTVEVLNAQETTSQKKHDMIELKLRVQPSGAVMFDHLVFMETAKNYLDLVIFDPARKLVPANRWQVFEERTFRNRRGDQPEPREALIVDVTGDGKNDLVVVVHDRILVYPQE